MKHSSEKRPPSQSRALETRERLLVATVALILRQGFPKTTVDEICTEAGTTKGSFFHHFTSKDAIGLAAADWWGAHGTSLYAAAWEEAEADPLEQLDRLFAIMESFTQREEPCTCVVGILAQEMALAHPVFREQCDRHLNDWTQNVAKILSAAKTRHTPATDFDPEQIAWFLNSLWQGSMLIGKTRQSPSMIRDNLRFARRWIDSLFVR